MYSKSLTVFAVAIIVISCAASAFCITNSNNEDDRYSDVVEQFLDICKVPRSSGHNEKIGEYLIDFAKEHNLAYAVDKVGNVMIDHPGTVGKGIILQAHQDMVPNTDPGVEHDFLTDPIDVIIDGDVIRAKGTTLGADDGTGIAIALCALKNKDLNDMKFRCIFTVDEETTMLGALSLNSDWLSGFSYLINIDSETENEITIGSAGICCIDYSFTKAQTPVSDCYTLKISGLHGGHSGLDINKGYANAVLLAAEFLNGLKNVRISSFNGGNATNAIPAYCTVTFTCTDTDLENKFNAFRLNAISEYSGTDPDMSMNLAQTTDSQAWSESSSSDIITSVLSIKNGVIRKNGNFVITSSNLGTASTDGGRLTLGVAIRSASDLELQEYRSETSAIFTGIGMTENITTNASGWLEVDDTPLQKKMTSVMTEEFGKETSVVVLHAGLECGEIKSKAPSIQAVSIGPHSPDVHTTKERTSIKSLETTYDVVIRVIAEGI